MMNLPMNLKDHAKLGAAYVINHCSSGAILISTVILDFKSCSVGPRTSQSVVYGLERGIRVACGWLR